MDELTVASWILLAVGAVSRTGEAPLEQVLAAADRVNHAVPLRDEVELAVQVLEGGGLLEGRGTSLRLTGAGRDEVERAGSASVQAAWTRLRNRLERLGIDERSGWQVSAAQFDAAVEAHLRRGRHGRRER